MNTGLVVVIIVLLLAVAGLFLWSQKLSARIAALRGEAERTRDLHAADLQRAVSEAQDTIRAAQAAVDEQMAALPGEIERIRQHYEEETRKVHVAAEAELSKALNELIALRKFAELGAAEGEVRQKLEDAAREAESVRAEAAKLLDDARTWSEEDRRKAADQAKKLVERANQTLDEATREAGRLVAEAEKQAEGVAGDAYIALRDKGALESAVAALWNVANGYGDRYVVPTHSVLDDLAEDFGHVDAGVALKAARDRTRRMVEQAQASACNYVEQDRRERANRFVVDAFNGRVDAILSRVRHDNYGTLVQEIRDAFSLVNLNGIAFRDARVLPAYLEARLDELKWAVAVYELRVKEREEQRRIKEQIREEEKARREYDKAMQQAQREEEIIRQAMDKARLQAELASADQKAMFNEQLALLSQKLTEAEARNQRAISMAQQTKKGNIYIISNIGAFGEDVFKIGMTRRLEPLDRVRELGDASVPFEFDVHAIIPADDAPTLEYQLHSQFDDLRVNKVNYRKEFFRLPLSRVREYLSSKGVDVSFTMVAEAHEYRESVALSKMTPEEREKHAMPQEAEDEVGVE
jgi:hypothetical protein